MEHGSGQPTANLRYFGGHRPPLQVLAGGEPPRATMGHRENGGRFLDRINRIAGVGRGKAEG